MYFIINDQSFNEWEHSLNMEIIMTRIMPEVIPPSHPLLVSNMPDIPPKIKNRIIPIIKLVILNEDVVLDINSLYNKNV